MEDDDDDNKATLGTDFESHKFTDVRPDGLGSIGIAFEWLGGRKLDSRQT